MMRYSLGKKRNINTTYALAFVATHNAKILISIAKYTAANANHITHVVYMEKPINFASVNEERRDNDEGLSYWQLTIEIFW